MKPSLAELAKRARREFPAPIDLGKRAERYWALLDEYGYTEEAPCEGSSQS